MRESHAKCVRLGRSGTGISLLQNRVMESAGIMRPKSELQPGISRKEIPALPELYTNLTHMPLLEKDVIISPMQCTLTSDGQLVKSANCRKEEVADRCPSARERRCPPECL